MTIAAPLLVEAFARELELAQPGRRSLTRIEYTEAFVRAFPHLLTSPDRDPHLGEVLAALEVRGVVRRSRRMDASGAHALPARITLLVRTEDTPVSSDVARYPWRPELSFASGLPLRRSEFEALVAVQAFLRAGASSEQLLPLAERSLALFGDEKRLDAMRRNRRLFGPGRLSLELLRAYQSSPPFAYTRTGSGPVALVLENAATYYSVLATAPREGPIGLVVFGGGNAFVSTVAYFSELVAQGIEVQGIRYFGDLDPEGLRIAAGADQSAHDLGLPRVLPAARLWSLLLERGRSGKHPPVPGPTARKLVAWLPAALRDEAADHLVRGSRLAQEAISRQVLGSDSSWLSLDGLGWD